MLFDKNSEVRRPWNFEIFSLGCLGCQYERIPAQEDLHGLLKRLEQNLGEGRTLSWHVVPRS